MKRTTFQFICDELRSELCPATPFLVSREPLSVELKVAVTLYYLASCCEYRVVANIFGIHKTSVWRCLHNTVDAINKILLPKFLKMPDVNECAIDGTHIPILPPADGYKDYINRKGWPSIILQAVVDNNLRFMNVNCQAPGSCHDAAIFKTSMLYKEVERIIPRKTKLVNGVEIPYFLIGDPAYPLLPWLMKGYTKVTRLTPQEESFNVYLNSNRVDIERAFG
ncbi:PREDICTED: putative nuclease HARBI1, partial [Cyphomyrmex costatus]|uniref:putative nuclease HARBI1 n=1 Tax=Cyphomyrmex costatus TaxID=456900 RepID=UPI0008522972